jgi:DNA-directed RNA polymerase subunit N (RpoN/RPB10)
VGYVNELSREELTARIAALEAENAALGCENAQLRQQLDELAAEVEMLREKLSGGGKGSSAVPFIKPNRAQRRAAERAERKKRSQSFVRRRDIPSEEVRHALERCPDCGHELTGGWEAGRRQVIEIPREPARIIDHVIIARRCGYCCKVHIPKLGISDGVVVKMRLGMELMSLITTLSVAKRMPQRSIQKLLEGLYGLHISLGEINEVLHRVSEWAKPTALEILQKIRMSPSVNADETGWREDGINGYLWSVSTGAQRFYYFHCRRADRIIRHILGGRFEGALGCDFYAGYDWYMGPKQRCWVHLFRLIDKVVQTHPSARAWADKVRDIYKAAKKASRRRADHSTRVLLREALQEKLLPIAEPYLKDKDAPQHKPAKLICRYLPELFTFVEHPNVASSNNAAERAIRPAVISRKISGGTRSARGSQTRTRLMSLFATWALEGKNPIAACAEMIAAANMPVAARPP